MVGGEAGYGTDSADCGGPRQVQRFAGPYQFYPDGRRLQNAGEAFTKQPPPPPPPPPVFSQKLPCATQASPPPPEPPPPPSPPPPPPVPSPPIDRNICKCSCTGSGSDPDEDFSSIALIAQAVPMEDTRLYIAKASVERGAELNPIIESFVSGVGNSINAFIPSPAQSVAVAHLLRGWLIPPTTKSTRSYQVPFTVTDGTEYDRLVWMEKCVGACGERANRYMLHYVQVNIREPGGQFVDCSCYESVTSPIIPDNSQAMDWAATNGARVANQFVDLYTIAPPRWKSSYEPLLGGTMYYELAYPAGTRMSAVLLTPSGAAPASALVCGHECINLVGKDTFQGFEYNPTTLACACSTYDPVAISTHAQILQDGSEFETYAAYWCEGARPSSNAGAYVYSTSLSKWCPGRVAGALGNAVIAGGVIDPAFDTAQTCQQNCANDANCNLIEVLGTSWHEVVGARPQFPTPPPSPPHPPQFPPPLYPPLPPNFPLLGAGDRLRTWSPIDGAIPEQDLDGQYSVTCGAPTSCGTVTLPVFRGDYLTVVTISRELQRDREFSSTLCPWEW